MKRKLTPPSPIVGVKGRRLGFIALADPRYFGSDQTKTLAVIIGQPERPEGAYVFQLASMRVHIMNASCAIAKSIEPTWIAAGKDRNLLN